MDLKQRITKREAIARIRNPRYGCNNRERKTLKKGSIDLPKLTMHVNESWRT